ncbi:MAG TPA: CapA family protein [Phycisphaerae bacterium]|nr:CapA family protein [Phycisphaerae bacterium]
MNDRVLTFGAVGDISLSRECGHDVQAHGTGWPFEMLLPVFEEAQLLFGNMESVVLPPGYPEDAIDPKALVSAFDGTGALAEAGFDIVNLAQNHILDGGWKGMFHTRDRIEALGVATAGVGRTQREARRMRVVEAAGMRVGFLCYGEDSNYTLGTAGPCHGWYVLEDVLADVSAGAGQVDALVVSVHADLEFLPTPSPARRDAFRRIASAGATVVLGHHPHVPQGMEWIDGRLIAYSLGNCFFEAHTSAYMKDNGPHTAHSFVLLAEIAGGRVRSFRRVPFEIPPPPNQRPVPLEGSAAGGLLEYFDELDRQVASDETVRANWRAKALAMLEIYLAKARGMEAEEVLEDLLGRLVLVAENRAWVEEVFEEVRSRWSRRAQRVDPWHRPHYVLERERGGVPGARG